MKKIPLTRGLFALVDDADFDWLMQWKWHAHSSRSHVEYAVRNKTAPCGKQTTVFMHREIMAASRGQVIDHVDMNGLNNQRSNIRFCTSSENQHNKKPRRDSRSQLKGVHFFHRNKRRPWCAKIQVNNKRLFLGYFSTQEEAAKAYDKKSLEVHGSFSCTNKTLGLI